jgi:hypothetical protein
MMLAVATSRCRSAQTVRVQLIEQRTKTGSKDAERRRIGEAQLASAG